MSGSNAMHGLDPGQLAILASQLEARRAALARQDAIDVVDSSHGLPVQEIETSPADKATVRLLNDLALEAAGMTAVQMRSVKRAIAKLADGSYGECEECGNPIGFSRLQASPDARLCISCQTRAEKRAP